MGKILMQGTGGGADLDLVTAKASDILQGKVIIGPDGEPLTGTIPILSARTITPGTGNQVINAGNYLGGNITVLGDGDLTAANIVYGKNIFGVAGNANISKSWKGNVTSSSSTKAFATSGGSSSYEYYIQVSNHGFRKILAAMVSLVSDWSGNFSVYNGIIAGCYMSSGTPPALSAIFSTSLFQMPVPSRNSSYEVTLIGY